MQAWEPDCRPRCRTFASRASEVCRVLKRRELAAFRHESKMPPDSASLYHALSDNRPDSAYFPYLLLFPRVRLQATAQFTLSKSLELTYG